MVSEDTTPPEISYVMDGLKSSDIDYVNSNTSLSAHWSAIDYESNYINYKYRIFANGTNITGHVEVNSSTQATVDTNLSIGINYSFEITAVNMNGLSSTAMSDGVFFDFINPNITLLESESHPDENTSYKNSTAIFNWNASDNYEISGYSYILDNDQYTEPDSEIETNETNTTFSSLAPGTHYFHLKAIDGAGNYDFKHRKIIVEYEGAYVTLNGLPRTTTSSSINLTGFASDLADIQIFVNGINQINITQNGTFAVDVSLNDGSNFIFANATKENLTTTSNTVYIEKSVPQLANLSITVSFSNTVNSKTKSRIVYYDLEQFVFGLASQSPAANPVSGNTISITTNESVPAFIFLSRPEPNLDRSNRLLERETFTDQEVPGFGTYSFEKYIVGTKLGYDDVVFIGNATVLSGKRSLVVQNKGLDEEGRLMVQVKAK
jgi:hypothetical protein